MRRNPPAKWVLPAVVNPAGKKCIILEVPDDPAHVAAFRGALQTLASAYNWADDPAHTAKDVALVWRDLIDSHQDWGCDTGRDTQLRVDDICTLSWTYDNWVTFDSFDPSACISALIDSTVPGMIGTAIQDAINDGTIQQPGGQPGPQSPPAPGGCKTFHCILPANGQWAIPVPIGWHDTIRVTNVRGGWSDGTIIWRCPDGAMYYLGICLEADKVHESTDPLNPGAYHMQLIMRIGNNYYPAPVDTTFTNNAGTTPITAVFQANDGILYDNTGSIEFDVEVCTGLSEGCYEFDFTTGEHGFVIYGWPAEGWVSGEYIPGEGYHTTSSGRGNTVSPFHQAFLGQFAFDGAQMDVYNPGTAPSAFVGSVWTQNGSLKVIGPTTIQPGYQTIDIGWTSTYANGASMWIAIQSELPMYMRRWRFLNCQSAPAGMEGCV